MAQSKITVGMLEDMRWHYLSARRPSYRSLAAVLGVSHSQIVRWRARGELHKVRKKYTIYARFATELTRCESIWRDRQDHARRAERAAARRTAPKASHMPQTKDFMECSDDEFERGLATFPDEAPAGLTYSFWPPKTVKGFQMAKRCAWESKYIPDKAWWEDSFESDPATWVKPGEEHLHEAYRHITGGSGGRYRAPMEEYAETKE